MADAVTLSGIIIAKNEQDRIGLALESLKFAKEIIVVDNGSTDSTVAIAKKAGARVISRPNVSFASLRDIGRKEARGSWIFYLDADEVVPSSLAQEIQEISKKRFNNEEFSHQYVCFFVRRNNFYMGHPWPVSDRMQRLFYKDALVSWHGDLHETPEVLGKTGQLAAYIDHNTHRTLEEMLAKTNMWSDIEAKLRYKAHHPAIVSWRLLRVYMTGFWHTYIHEGGWRAGTVGMIESMYQGFSLFITYAKLWEMQQKNKTL
jgi:glycosyltransferase involved in cell wall biosynthesis